MSTPPYEVSSFLYSGIGSAIDRLIRAHENKKWDDLDSTKYLQLIVAVDWYTENCIVSSQFLKDDLKVLSDKIEGLYFIYNLHRYHRFTMRSHISNKIIEEHDLLIDRREQLKQVSDIALGTIIKFNGHYLKITEIHKDIDPKYGRFVAETLSLEELIQYKKKKDITII